jgi:hypothetical protein
MTNMTIRRGLPLQLLDHNRPGKVSRQQTLTDRQSVYLRVCRSIADSGWLPSCISPYTSEPFTTKEIHGTLALVKGMPVSSVEDKRRGVRTKAVLPVRIKGKDSSGSAFDELAITLDVTAGGVRLGSIRRELNVLDEITVFYRQRKIQFRVMWTKKMKGTSEFQAGLQAVTQEKEVWGLNLPDQPVPQQSAQASVVA